MLFLTKHKSGFSITYNDKVIFEQLEEPNGKTWTKSIINKMGNDVFQNYLNSLFIEPAKERVRTHYKQILAQPVLDNQYCWNADASSFINLKSEIDAAQMKNHKTVEVFDFYNKSQTLSLSECKRVAILVHTEFKIKLKHKQTLLLSLNKCKNVKSIEDIISKL